MYEKTLQTPSPILKFSISSPIFIQLYLALPAKFHVKKLFASKSMNQLSNNTKKSNIHMLLFHQLIP